MKAAAGETSTVPKGMKRPSSQSGLPAVSPWARKMKSVSTREKLRLSQLGRGRSCMLMLLEKRSPDYIYGRRGERGTFAEAGRGSHSRPLPASAGWRLTAGGWRCPLSVRVGSGGQEPGARRRGPESTARDYTH